MRVQIDEEYLEPDAAEWWRKASPADRAILIQALFECGHGAEQSDNPHEDAIKASNRSNRAVSSAGAAVYARASARSS